MSEARWDVVIAGGGPAGATCGALCARAGLKVAIVEREIFPREKVCGDCLNPNCWPIFDRLGLSPQVRALPHAELRAVDFVDTSGRRLSFPLPLSERGEIAVKRSALDRLLLDHAQAAGATLFSPAAVTAVIRESDGWRIEAGVQPLSAHVLIAADGRNSTVARLLGLLPAAARDRVGLQTHFPLPAEARERVVMRFLPKGYCGLSDVGGGEGNLCLVARPPHLAEVKAWATQEFALASDHSWRSITPLQRGAASAQHPSLLLVGDAARVVEPFTGEGIFYALATGALAADCVMANKLEGYAAAHRGLYRGRLWVNLVARAACKHSTFASAMLGLARRYPASLGLLTRKVVRSRL